MSVEVTFLIKNYSNIDITCSDVLVAVLLNIRVRGYDLLLSEWFLTLRMNVVSSSSSSSSSSYPTWTVSFLETKSQGSFERLECAYPTR